MEDITRRLDESDARAREAKAARPRREKRERGRGRASTAEAASHNSSAPSPPQDTMQPEDILRMMAEIQQLDPQAMEHAIETWQLDKCTDSLRRRLINMTEHMTGKGSSARQVCSHCKMNSAMWILR